MASAPGLVSGGRAGTVPLPVRRAPRPALPHAIAEGERFPALSSADFGSPPRVEAKCTKLVIPGGRVTELLRIRLPGMVFWEVRTAGRSRPRCHRAPSLASLPREKIADDPPPLMP